MKKHLKLVLMAITLISFNAFADGGKEGGGDNSTVFKCESAPNVDSALQIIGYGDEFTSDIVMKISIAGKILVVEEGFYDSSMNSYMSDTFSIEFGNVSRISAHAPNPVLSVHTSDSLVCELLEVQ